MEQHLFAYVSVTINIFYQHENFYTIFFYHVFLDKRFFNRESSLEILIYFLGHASPLTKNNLCICLSMLEVDDL